MEQTRRTETDGAPPPEGYLSVEAFVAERHHEFPALHEAPSPAPIGVAPGRRRASTPSEEPWR